MKYCHDDYVTITAIQPDIHYCFQSKSDKHLHNMKVRKNTTVESAKICPKMYKSIFHISVAIYVGSHS